MIGNRTTESSGGVPLVGVAAKAGGVCRSEIVVVVDVAIGARRGDVRASQGEARSAVIEVSGAPSRGGVAI